MEWVYTFRATVTAELRAAEAVAELRRVAYDVALSECNAIDTRVSDLRRVLLSLNQLDPATAVPEPPL